MSRLAPLDKVLVLILFPLWVGCFGFAVSTQGQGFAPLGLSLEDTDSYPVLTGQFATGHSWDPFDEGGLQAGDRLVRVGDADLRGVNTVGFIPRASEEAGKKLAVPLVFERDGERREILLELAPVSTFLPLLATSFSLAGSALFLLLRARPTPSVRAFFHLGMCFALALCFMNGSVLEFQAHRAIVIVTATAGFPLLIRFISLFPDDREPKGRWRRVWPWFLAPPAGLFSALYFTGQMGVGLSGQLLVVVLGAVAAVAVATTKYRQADPIARRQMRWVVFGVYCFGLSMGVTGGLSVLEPGLAWLFYASNWTAAIFPLFLLVSVARFNLFDIDRILSAAASYNILAILLGAGALILVPRVAEAVSGVAGVDPGTGQVVFSLALAAVVIPAHRRLRPQIDRLFFKERYALDQGIAELLPTLSACSNMRQLTERVGSGLDRLLRPEACAVYARVEQSYAPVFAEGAAVPPAFEAGSSLIVTLRERRAPLSLSGAGRRPDEAPLGPFDRAALETLGAEVVMPVRQGDALAAFVCLGPKRSGDVYTSTDLSLLAAVTETVSQQLQRFDQDEVIREGREMQESLRRYVPGAVAEQLASGTELSSGEREVTVLFVDIRGYTGFSENRKAEEIFSTVNRYTETVSQIVQKHAGSVVEFNGDGMMAVFGAPRELAHKERAAVEAGREIVEAVAALRIEDATGEQTELSVGVGIATGEAFVGNIRAVDRMIWSAIGNTTNLAARLQSLTREFDASLVIDTATWERAQPAAADFERRDGVTIRGRRKAQDVFALPAQR